MKPFDLVKALSGDAVINRRGDKIKEIHLLKSNVVYPLICVLENNECCALSKEGECNFDSKYDLFMQEESKKFFLIVQNKDSEFVKRFFSLEETHQYVALKKSMGSFKEDYKIIEVEFT